MKLLATVISVAALIAAPVCVRAEDCRHCEADFAIYNPDYEDDGVWEEEVTALEHMFRAFKWSYRSVSHLEINAGALGSGTKRKFRALIAPGGWSWWREAAVSPEGDNHIRQFLKSGGNYVGFCAGAYAASKQIVWAQQASGAEGRFSTPADYSGNYPYQLAIYPDDAKGPLGWIPWRSGTGVNFSIAKINLDNSTMKRIGLPKETRFLYGGGPFFPAADKIDGLEVWARAVSDIPGLPSESGNGQPTVIRYPSGKGSVTLFSYHPDVLIKHEGDGIALKQFFDENSINWERGNQSFDQINLDSWNIVHAALQLAAGQDVTPLTKIP